MTWQALPSGEAISVASGMIYAVIASVKDSHTEQDLISLASSKWGLTVLVYAEQGDANYPSLPAATTSGYKTVYGVLQGTKTASVPWSVSSAGGIFGGAVSFIAGDSSSIEYAWSSSDLADQNNPPTAWVVPASAAAVTPPPAPQPVISSSNAAPSQNVMLGTAIAAGVSGALAGAAFLFAPYVAPAAVALEGPDVARRPRKGISSRMRHRMNALEELMYNPIGSKWLWALGIGAGALAVGATAYAATRSTAQTAAQPGTSTPGNPLTDGPTQQAVATIVLGFENGTGTAIDLCSSGSAAVMAFQNAWNAAAQGNSQYQQLPTTGLYDQATATAAQQVNGNAPSFPNCASTSTTSGS